MKEGGTAKLWRTCTAHVVNVTTRCITVNVLHIQYMYNVHVLLGRAGASPTVASIGVIFALQCTCRPTVRVYDREKAWGRGGLGTRLGSIFETTLAQ